MYLQHIFTNQAHYWQLYSDRWIYKLLLNLRHRLRASLVFQISAVSSLSSAASLVFTVFTFMAVSRVYPECIYPNFSWYYDIYLLYFCFREEMPQAHILLLLLLAVIFESHWPILFISGCQYSFFFLSFRCHVGFSEYIWRREERSPWFTCSCQTLGLGFYTCIYKEQVW